MPHPNNTVSLTDQAVISWDDKLGSDVFEPRCCNCAHPTASRSISGQREKGTNFVQREAELARPAAEHEDAQILLIENTPAGAGTLRWREHPKALVVPDVSMLTPLKADSLPIG